jgi:ribose 5-phosphate isomerase B
VASKKEGRGILACGTGIGMAISANKIKGIRAAVVWSSYVARKAVEENAANIITLPARVISDKESLAAVSSFLEAKPSRLARHVRRVNKIKALEK